MGPFLTCFRSHFLMNKVPPASRPSRLPPTSSHALHNDQQLNSEPYATVEEICDKTNVLLSSDQYKLKLSRLLQLLWLLNCCFSFSSSRLPSINIFLGYTPQLGVNSQKGKAKQASLGGSAACCNLFHSLSVKALGGHL